MARSAHLEWGVRGARNAAARGDVAVVVDVLRFSSAVVAAVAAGVTIYPYRGRNRGSFAKELGAELARPTGSPSLSPGSFEGMAAGTKVVLPSANGSTITAILARSCPVFAGSLLNASAVADAAAALARERDSGLTVVACGERPTERWQEERSYEFRPAIEDWLAAGAILAALGDDAEMTAEAVLAATAYKSAGALVLPLVTNCESGVELREKGLGADVECCARVDVFAVAPSLVDGGFR